MKLSDREKAALLVGMVRAFKATRWPKHFNRDDKSQWLQRERLAKQLLDGGCFNPFDHWTVIRTVDDELGIGDHGNGFRRL